MSLPDDLTNAHLTLADENFEFARLLMNLDSAPPRWVVVVSFYSAVHYLGAYFWEQFEIEVSSHRHRGRLMRTIGSVQPVREHYERLYQWSLVARYRPFAHVSERDVRDLLETDLLQIRQVLTAAMDG